MPETVKKIASLILKYWRQELEEDELNELLDWANHSPANREAFTRLTNPDFIVGQLRELTLVKQEMRHRIWTELQLSDTAMEEPGIITDEHDRRFSFLKMAWWKWTVAVVLLLIAGGLFFWLAQPSTSRIVRTAGAGTMEGKQESPELPARSQFRFADGRLLYPDTMKHGAVLEHGQLKLTREAGGIRVNTAADPRSADSASFTTISTPAGEGITVWLHDGTEVKLNAASLLRFPAVFTVHGRTVQASGELYFQVAQQGTGGSQIPFFVHTSCMNLEAPAARFNVHVYPQDKLAAATLEEGSLRVWKQVLHTASGTNSGDRVDVILEPGQQAQISNGNDGTDMGGIRVEQINLQKVLSWKNEPQHK